MPTDAPKPLPERPHLRHLKNQAKDLLKAGGAATLAVAQLKIARQYGFSTWVKLKTHVDSFKEFGQLKLAIDTNQLEQVKRLMTRNPELHRAPLGYGKNGPLTWVAECRVPWAPPSAERLTIAEWMIEHGSDVHQGGDGPLMRASLLGHRVPMMELLVSHGADVNALWNGYFPIIFAPCETMEPASLRWLLEHGANPNCPQPREKFPGTALDYVIHTYGRSEQLGRCIDLLLEAGGETSFQLPAVLDLLRSRQDRLAERLRADGELLGRKFPELEFGVTGTRTLTLRGGTLLHVAAEYGNLPAAQLLLECGADVNARAEEGASGVGGQTPIFHAVTQFHDAGLPVVQRLLERGADLAIRVSLPGHYQRPGEVVECTPLGYALRFPGVEHHAPNRKTIALLRDHGAPE